MASEIRVNKIINRSGLSTVSFSDDGAIVSGIVSATVYTGSGANLTDLPAGNLSGTVSDARISTLTASKLSGDLPAISAANLTNLPAANITGTLPAIDGSALTGINTAFGNSSVNTTGIITATAFVPSQGQLSHRNLIINGAMKVAQRGTSSTSNGYQTIDRFRSDIGSTSTTFTQSQQDLSSSDAPFALGFRKYKRIALAGAGTAAAGTYVEATAYRVEAQDLASSGWDYTSSSSYVTLQFWFRCSTNQTFYTAIRMDDGTARMFSFSFTASGNNTWTKVTKTIPGNSGITINNDNGIGMSIFIIPYYGTNFTANGTALDTWNTYDSAAHFPDMASTWLTAGASTFDLTGVQLEVGSVATPFEHKSFIEDKLRCYRYFYQPERGSYTLDLNGAGHRVADTMGAVVQAYPWPVEMRAAPTLSYDDNNGNSNRVAINGSNNSTTFNVLISLQQNTQGIMGAFQYPHGITNISENESFRLWAYNFKASAEL